MTEVRSVSLYLRVVCLINVYVNARKEETGVLRTKVETVPHCVEKGLLHDTCV